MSLMTGLDIFSEIDWKLDPPAVPPTKEGIEQVVAWTSSEPDVQRLQSNKLEISNMTIAGLASGHVCRSGSANSIVDKSSTPEYQETYLN